MSTHVISLRPITIFRRAEYPEHEELTCKKPYVLDNITTYVQLKFLKLSVFGNIQIPYITLIKSL